MGRRSWSALCVALAVLLVAPTAAVARKGATTTRTQRSTKGFLVTTTTFGDPQQKLFWCVFGRYPDYIPGMPTQPAASLINFGLGWGVYEEVQSYRVRDLQAGTLKLEQQSGDSWIPVYDVAWADGRWLEGKAAPGEVAGDYAWGEPYEFTTSGGFTFWRTDWELHAVLDPGHYRLTDVNFELTAGTVNAGAGGDPPGPWMTYSGCEFDVQT